MSWNFLGILLFKANGFGRSFLRLFFGFGFICTRSICFSSQWNLGFCGTIKIVLCCDLGLYLPFLTWKFLTSLLPLLLYMFWFFGFGFGFLLRTENQNSYICFDFLVHKWRLKLYVMRKTMRRMINIIVIIFLLS
jgi:hypothetical protein